ncbi:hypothetical protein ACFQ4A_13535 [Lentibacillus salinarum]|uniref:Uncharacterized protein n=2 Tax=Lentibacillus salinarum TaxID=446820 RepID=A0ABW3ZWX8_9BACI
MNVRIPLLYHQSFIQTKLKGGGKMFGYSMVKLRFQLVDVIATTLAAHEFYM